MIEEIRASVRPQTLIVSIAAGRDLHYLKEAFGRPELKIIRCMPNTPALVLEGCTFNMTSIWFAIGSAAALLCCVFTGSFRVQAVVFLVVSILCLAAFRPLAAKLRLKHTATNGDRNLGREAIVLSPVTAEVPGRVRLDGVDWNARCATPGDTLGPGALCRVTEIHSTLLIVEPVLTESRNPHTTT